MVNTLQTIRNHEGDAIAFWITGGGAGTGKRVELYGTTVGENINGACTIGGLNLGRGGSTHTFTLDLHDSDNGVAGASHHAELIGLTTHTTHPHGQSTVIPRWKIELGKLGLSIANIFGRLAALEKQAGAIEFDEWSMKGTILTGKLGTRNVCRINLGGDFDIDQVEYNDVAEDDGQRLLTISKNGITRKFHTFTSNDLSAITDQAMNPQPGTIVSNVPKPTT